jgi:hypothetical protein
MGDFEQMAAPALALAGVPFEQDDLALLRVVAQAFEPAMRALDGAELAELPLETDLDPSRPPRPAPAFMTPSRADS